MVANPKPNQNHSPLDSSLEELQILESWASTLLGPRPPGTE